MRLIGRIIGRLFAVGFSYVIACVAAGLMVAGSYVVPAWFAGTIAIENSQLMGQTLFVSGMVASFVAVYAFAPAMVAAVVAEVFSIRRALYYVVCGGLAGLIGYAAYLGGTPEIGRDHLLVAAAGVVAGWVYWLLGGRSAGVLERPAA